MPDTRTYDTADDMLMGGSAAGGKAVSFGPLGARPGRRIRLKLTEPGRIVEQRDQDGNALTWDDGRPKQQPAYTGTCHYSDDGGQTWQLAVDADDERDPGDGTRTLYVKMSNQEGGMSRAIREAVQAAKASKPEPGGVLELEWYGQVPVGRGHARQYRGTYTAPADGLLMGDATPQVADSPRPDAAPAAPAPAAAAASPVEQVKALLALGLDDSAIAAAVNLTPAVVAAIRAT